jgi:Tfp pilus assembly protein FimT
MTPRQYGRAGSHLAHIPGVNRNKHLSSAAGFTLIDMVVVVGLIAVMSAMATVSLRDMSESMRLSQGAREVERELQTARLKAVSSNRPVRVRFNCPTAGKYRMVELIGSTNVPVAEDGAANRCQESVYPFPAADRNPVTLPNLDGPLRSLHSSLSFGAFQTLEFWPNGTVHADTGVAGAWPELPTTGTAITVVKGTTTKTITVNGLGKIQLQ